MSAFRKLTLIRAVFVAMVAMAAATTAYAQEPPKTPIEAPAEPNAIALETGGVEGQTAKETWYKQWGDPFVRNVSRATLTPFLPDSSAHLQLPFPPEPSAQPPHQAPGCPRA